MQRRRRLGQKGFSLVELIIVIAIMAALIAILAPMLIRYVQSSRQSADLANFEIINTAFRAAVIDPVNDVRDDMVLTWALDGGVIEVDNVSAVVDPPTSPEERVFNAVRNTLDADTVDGRSNVGRELTLTITYTALDNGGSGSFRVTGDVDIDDGNLKSGLEASYNATFGP
jgi:prepilin-type N-terminal cleavage/methylation domain-containing protein